MDGFSPAASPGNLCATAARRRSQQRKGAKVRKLTPIPQAKPGSRYRPVRVIEAKVMASVSEEDKEPLAELAKVRWSPASPSPRRHPPRQLSEPRPSEVTQDLECSVSVSGIEAWRFQLMTTESAERVAARHRLVAIPH
ncbi:hypothetical protein HPB50_015306 [Hyalomma asiaticum]|uniref:Uncharacterized protein n=1 Tax=Hyalomma asiaticum TaxID=266040 RepID=A0ACB7TKC7_HYAAI|nr:hypothetical protein HPB50_015306 [Hyalomma asiaticum]